MVQLTPKNPFCHCIILNLKWYNSVLWCDAKNVELERLYGTDLHQRGATLPDLGLGMIPRGDLACLRPDEIGDPQYTLEGWLDAIEKRSLRRTACHLRRCHR